ncbi:MAG: thymidine phosphorylase [Fidelibacterota bacterium]
MNISRLVEKKTGGGAHTPEEIAHLVDAYTRGGIPDREMTRWLKAVFDHGMTDEETLAVVDGMMASGERVDFSFLDRFVADKHSTGGVGDKVSLVLAPLMASAGLAIPMITGRSLGHTGGTCDKLESIPGYRTNLSMDEFVRVVEDVGASIIGQTDWICPADRKIYALRDATGTIASTPLICGSIMSKKIAEGIQGLVLDIKVGSGAFMKTLDDARKLGEKLIMVGRHFGVSTEAVYSDMNQPLGYEVGLWNEVEESVRALRGKGPDDLMDLTFRLGSILLIQARLVQSEDEARALQTALISSGKALETFLDMVQAHGGDTSDLEEPSGGHLRATFSRTVTAPRGGFLVLCDTLELGRAAKELTVFVRGKARAVDPTGGIRLHKKLGEEVKAGDELAVCFGEDRERVEGAFTRTASAFTIGEELPKPPVLTY